jgi:heat shock protein HslJ
VCPAGEISDQAHGFTGLLYEGPEWVIDQGQLVLTGDTGTVARLRKDATNAAVGVWNLTELNGHSIGANITLTFSARSRFSGYVGCWINGDYEITGNQLSVSALPPEVGPEDRDGVSPQFLCETLNEQEQQFLELIEAGQGVIQGHELTIMNQAGAAASFRRQ